MIGKIQRVPLREVWRHEARDFTTWLRDNIDVLNEVLGRELANPENEQSAGSFNIDLIAEDENGNAVIIENQLEKSNHDHLGKLITYLTMVDAKTAIWIVAEPRPEHVQAINWLNETSAATFYLLKVEGIRIGDSAPAPLLTLIVGPSEESREAGQTKKNLAERHFLRRRFWTELLERAKQRTRLHVNISPGDENWVGAGAGKRGLGLSYVIRQHDAHVELYIDRGTEAQAANEEVFDQLLSARAEIESAFGDDLEWQRLDGKRACRIKKNIEAGGYRDEDKWPEIHDNMIGAMIRLDKALRPHISKLRI